MRRLLLAILFLLLTYVSFSQGPINIGIKFGTNSSTMLTNIDDVLNQNIREDKVDYYLAGAFIRVNLGRLYLQPEAYFNTKGGIVTQIGDGQYQIPSLPTFEYKTIDVPVLMGIKLINKSIFNLRVHGGPVFSYVTANSFVSEMDEITTEDLNNRYVGWQIGAGLDIWFLTFDARIENSTNILNEASPYNVKNRVYLLSAGIKLF
ncbi:MAG: porin family protein [Prolixibacteraceae bacterium]|jgi:hypothetical protein|nr:porin family protein [Prolixibacteraceae bacterium]